MKNILVILSFLVLISCQSENNYQITGNIQDIPDSTIIDLYLQYENMGVRIKSDTILNGRFEFADTLSIRPSKMSLRARDFENFSGGCNLWVDYGQIEVTGTGKYLSGWTVQSDIMEQQALNNILDNSRKLSIQIDSLNLESAHKRDDRKLSIKNRALIDSLSALKRKIEFEVIKESYNSRSAVEKLYQFAKFDTTISKVSIRNIYKKIDTAYTKNLYGEGIMAILNKGEIPEIGDKILDIEAFDIYGEKHRLSEYLGKYILLDFWSLACYPCVLAAPELRELNSEYDNILTVVGLSVDTNMQMWMEGTQRDSITWTNLSDGKGTFSGAATKYGVTGLPTYILINPDGTIIDKWMGFSKGIFKRKLGEHIESMDD